MFANVMPTTSSTGATTNPLHPRHDRSEGVREHQEPDVCALIAAKWPERRSGIVSTTTTAMRRDQDVASSGEVYVYRRSAGQWELDNFTPTTGIKLAIRSARRQALDPGHRQPPSAARKPRRPTARTYRSTSGDCRTARFQLLVDGFEILADNGPVIEPEQPPADASSVYQKVVRDDGRDEQIEEELGGDRREYPHIPLRGSSGAVKSPDW